MDEDKLLWINKKHFRWLLQDGAFCRELAAKLAECVKTTLRCISALTLGPTLWLARSGKGRMYCK